MKTGKLVFKIETTLADVDNTIELKSSAELLADTIKAMVENNKLTHNMIIEDYTDQRKQELRDLLKKIADFINVEDSAAKLLWNILTALRGPDDDETFNLKTRTTSVIRSVVGFKKNRLFDVNESIKARENVFREIGQPINEHFRCHLIYVLKALVSLGYIKEN